MLEFYVSQDFSQKYEKSLISNYCM